MINTSYLQWLLKMVCVCSLIGCASTMPVMPKDVSTTSDDAISCTSSFDSSRDSVIFTIVNVSESDCAVIKPVLDYSLSPIFFDRNGAILKTTSKRTVSLPEMGDAITVRLKSKASYDYKLSMSVIKNNYDISPLTFWVVFRYHPSTFSLSSISRKDVHKLQRPLFGAIHQALALGL